MAESVVWAQPPEEKQDDAGETDTHGQVDESFAARRLRRWLRGMFGGERERPQDEADKEGNT
jgi:hypothetical protein